MNIEDRLQLSYYQEIAVIDKAHRVSLVQHIETKKIFVRKILSVYNESVYRYLMEHPVTGIPRIECLCREKEELTVVEEYISGSTFEELLSEHGPYSETEVCDYGIRLCDILLQLHAFDPAIIHRDIKPSNVMLTSSGALYLLDLNAAKFFRPGEETDTVLLGTQGYAAPEQYGFGSSDIRTDIYAAGMLLNALLNGSFSQKVTSDSGLGTVLRRCLQLNADDRYRDAGELRYALMELAHPETLPDPEIPAADRWALPGFRRRDPSHMIIGALGYALLIYLSATLRVENAEGIMLFVERLFCFLMTFATVLFTCNYRNIQERFPLSRSPRKPVRIFGILLYDLAFLLALMVFMILLEMVFFQ